MAMPPEAQALFDQVSRDPDYWTRYPSCPRPPGDEPCDCRGPCRRLYPDAVHPPAPASSRRRETPVQLDLWSSL